MANISPSKAVRKQFVERAMPVMESWGLSRHPDPVSSFGGDQFGYRYDFADLSKADEIKIAAFGILNPGPQLWIKGLRINQAFHANADVPVIFDNVDGVFTLTRAWSILRPTNIRFEFHKRRSETNEDAAARLIDAVLSDFHKLKKFLYD